MTVADYINLSQTSLNNFFAAFVPAFTNIVASLVALAVGIAVGTILKRVVVEVSKSVNFERVAASWSWYDNLVKSHEHLDVTTLVGEAARWIAIIVFLIPAVASLQIEGADVIFSAVFGYISAVTLASLYLLFGFVIAWFVHRIVMVVAAVVGNNPAHLIANVAYLAIVIFAALGALSQLGVSLDLVRLLIIASFAALALAFGLAGRDTAAEWVKRLVSRASK